MKTKKQIIREYLANSDASYDLIALKADCDISYVKTIEKELRAEQWNLINKNPLKFANNN